MEEDRSYSDVLEFLLYLLGSYWHVYDFTFSFCDVTKPLSAIVHTTFLTKFCACQANYAIFTNLMSLLCRRILVFRFIFSLRKMLFAFVLYVLCPICRIVLSQLAFYMFRRIILLSFGSARTSFSLSWEVAQTMRLNDLAMFTVSGTPTQN